MSTSLIGQGTVPSPVLVTSNPLYRVLGHFLAILTVCLPAIAQAQIYSADWGGPNACSAEAGVTTQSTPGGCNWAHLTEAARPQANINQVLADPPGNPAGCAMYVNLEACSPGTQATFTLPTVDASGLEDLQLSIDVHATQDQEDNKGHLTIEIDSSAPECLSSPCQTINIARQNGWQLNKTFDISLHAGQSDVSITFRGDDLDAGGTPTFGLAFGVDNIAVTGSVSTTQIVITRPDPGALVVGYPATIEVAFDANALDTYGSRVELWGLPVGEIVPDSSATGSMQIGSYLVPGTNVVKVCLTGGPNDICDSVPFEFRIPTGDVNGDGSVTSADANALSDMIVQEDPYHHAGDVSQDGVLDIIDVVLIINRIVDLCDEDSSNLGLGRTVSDLGCGGNNPSLLTDGTIDGTSNLYSSCSSTESWVEVDLNGLFTIDFIDMYISDANPSNVDDMIVEIYNGATLVDSFTGFGYFPHPDYQNPNRVEFLISQTDGDRVRIIKDPPGSTISSWDATEVVVWGFPAHNVCELAESYIAVYEFNDGAAGSAVLTSPDFIQDSGSEDLDGTANAEIDLVTGDPARGGIGSPNAALNLDGAEWVDIPHLKRGDLFDFESFESFHVSAVVKTSAGVRQTIASNWDNGAGAGWYLDMTASGTVEFFVKDVLGNSKVVTSAATINNGAWHDVIAVRDAVTDQLLIYIDNNPAITVQTSTPPNALSAALGNNQPIRLGARSNGTQSFVGAIDVVTLANFAIDPFNATIALPYWEDFDINPGFATVGLEGTIGGPSSWTGGVQMSSSSTDNLAFTENSDIRCSGACQQSAIPNGTTVAYGDPSWDDTESYVWVRTPEANGMVGLLTRFQDNNNFYGLILDNVLDPAGLDFAQARLVARVGGISTTLASVPYTYPAGEWIQLNIEVEGGAIEGRFGASGPIRSVDARLDSGRVGLFTYSTAAGGTGYNDQTAFDGLGVVPAGFDWTDYEDGFGEDRGIVGVDDGAAGGTPSSWAVVQSLSTPGCSTGSEPECLVMRQNKTVNGGVGSPPFGAVGVMGSVALDSYSLEADVFVILGADTGLVFRYQDSENFMRFSLNTTNTATLGRMENGVWETLGTHVYNTGLVQPTAGYERIGIEADGARIRAYLYSESSDPIIDVNLYHCAYTNGTTPDHLPCTDLTHGAFGLFNQAASTRADNLALGGSACGNGTCEPDEVAAGGNPTTCAEDCSTCGDGLCDPWLEDRINCPDDCAYCGDGFCDLGYNDDTVALCGGAGDGCCDDDGDCDDGNVCTTDVCDLSTNICGNSNNTVSCNDSNDCTYNDVCSGGSCGGSTVDCSDAFDEGGWVSVAQDGWRNQNDFNQGGSVNRSNDPTIACELDLYCNNTSTCQSGTPTAGLACSNLIDPDGGGPAPPQEEWCTENDTCQFGGTSWSCVAGTDPCTSGHPCGNGCALDYSLSRTDCNTPSGGASCDDGNGCTTGETCNGSSDNQSACSGGTSLTCATSPHSQEAEAGTCGETFCESTSSGWTINGTSPINYHSPGNPFPLDTLVDTQHSGIHGDSAAGNCGDINSNGSHWYSFLASDNVAQDRTNGGDQFGIHIWFRRNDDQAFRYRVYSDRTTVTNAQFASNPSSRGCTAYTLTNGGPGNQWPRGNDSTCWTTPAEGGDFFTTLLQNPCANTNSQPIAPWSGQAHCEDNDTKFWIQVANNSGAPCDSCETYSLRVTNGHECGGTFGSCPSGTACSTPDPISGYSFPRRCEPIGTIGDSGNVGTLTPARWTLYGTGGYTRGFDQRAADCFSMEALGAPHWYSFVAADNLTHDRQDGGDTWGVNVLLAQNPANHYQFDVRCQTLSGGTLTGGAPHCQHPSTGLSGTVATSYTRTTRQAGKAVGICYDPSSMPPNAIGYSGCNSNNACLHHCSDNSAEFFVRVDQVSSCSACLEYKIEFTNGI